MKRLAAKTKIQLAILGNSLLILVIWAIISQSNLFESPITATISSAAIISVLYALVSSKIILRPIKNL